MPVSHNNNTNSPLDTNQTSLNLTRTMCLNNFRLFLQIVNVARVSTNQVTNNFSFNRPFHVFLFTGAKLRVFPLIKLPMIFNRQFQVRFFMCVSTNQVNFYVLMFL